jgi:hypothetical protein
MSNIILFIDKFFLIFYIFLMGSKEKNLINDYLSNLPGNMRMFRTNSGMGWAGKSVRKDDAIIIKNARPFHGMPEGWPDLTGWETVVITPDMVGQKIAVFSVVEVKTGSTKLSKKQNQFKELILKMGGRFLELRTT